MFEGNFKRTYIHPGNSWDLSKCKQKLGESLREYAQCFSKQRTMLPHIPGVGAFFSHESGKWKVLVSDDEVPSKRSKKGKKKKKTWPIKRESLDDNFIAAIEAPRRGPSSTKCSKSTALITREGRITSSRTIAC